MVKRLLIVVLSLALLGAAAATRPSEASFQSLVRQRMSEGADGFFDKLLLGGRIDGYLRGCVYRNRVLWADVEKDGRTIYTGAFGHWFERGEGMRAPAKVD